MRGVRAISVLNFGACHTAQSRATREMLARGRETAHERQRQEAPMTAAYT